MALSPEPASPASPAPLAPLDDAAQKRVRRVELLISKLLRIGVTLSFVIIVTGITVTFVHHPEYTRDSKVLPQLIGNESAFPQSIAGVVRGVLAGSGQAIVLAGLLVLISTPVLRVAVSIFAFVYERDRIFVCITSVVLGLLLLSFLIGKAGG